MEKGQKGQDKDPEDPRVFFAPPSTQSSKEAQIRPLNMNVSVEVGGDIIHGPMCSIGMARWCPGTQGRMQHTFLINAMAALHSEEKGTGSA